jgi:hypothetical protein
MEHEAGRLTVPAMMSLHAINGTSPTHSLTVVVQALVLVIMGDEQSSPLVT